MIQPNIVARIVARKREEVAERKHAVPEAQLAKSECFFAPVVSLLYALRRSGATGIIAEIKRASPTKGVLHKTIAVEQVARGYVQAGASALSILTDETFFCGKNDDITTAWKHNCYPILRKDFILDEYQITEARAIGADAVLLIASVLSPERTRALAAFAHALELEVVLEVHSREEIESHINEYVDIVGVNNRDLTTFQVDVERSFALIQHIPRTVTAIAESGIANAATAALLRAAGFHGFLIGEAFMATDNPAQTCTHFIETLRKEEQKRTEVLYA